LSPFWYIVSGKIWQPCSEEKLDIVFSSAVPTASLKRIEIELLKLLKKTFFFFKEEKRKIRFFSPENAVAVIRLTISEWLKATVLPLRVEARVTRRVGE
jgi:hypothetical protein